MFLNRERKKKSLVDFKEKEFYVKNVLRSFWWEMWVEFDIGKWLCDLYDLEKGRTMEIEHCMHELVPFLDILCAMSRLLVSRVNHLKDHIFWTSWLTWIKKPSLTQPNDLDQLTICKNSPDVLCLMNVRVGWFECVDAWWWL